MLMSFKKVYNENLLFYALYTPKYKGEKKFFLDVAFPSPSEPLDFFLSGLLNDFTEPSLSVWPRVTKRYLLCGEDKLKTSSGCCLHMESYANVHLFFWSFEHPVGPTVSLPEFIILSFKVKVHLPIRRRLANSFYSIRMIRNCFQILNLIVEIWFFGAIGSVRLTPLSFPLTGP